MFNQVTQNDPLVAEQDWEAEEWESESDGEELATHDHSNYLIQETMWETPAPPPCGSLYKLTQNTLGADLEMPDRQGEGKREPLKPI